MKTKDIIVNEKLLLPESKLYELAINNKQHNEDRRDEINTYYITLFAAIIAAIPFIDKVAKAAPAGYEGYIVRGSLTIISLIGLILAVTWASNLKRTFTIMDLL